MSLPLLQHEAVIGPSAPTACSLKVAGLFRVALRLGEDGLAGQDAVDIPGGGHLDSVNKHLRLGQFSGVDQDAECRGKLAAAPRSAPLRDLGKFPRSY